MLFTDIVGSTELMQRLGDDRYHLLRRRHMELLRGQVAAHGGDEVKSEGDALMAVFVSAVDAIGCGVAMQRAIHRHHAQHDDSEQLPLRVGMDAGEPIREGNDYHGTPVVIASRLSNDANGGQILVSQLVQRLVGSRGGYTFRELEPRPLKGILEPVHVCEVEWEPSSDDEPATETAQTPTPRLPLPATLVMHQPETFVGREAQLKELHARWDQAKQGGCEFVLLTGEPGTGKSSLAAEFAGQAYDDGALVLYGRCVSGSPLRVQLFVEALRPLLTGPMSERILPKHRELAAALAPDLGGTSGDIALASLSAAVTSLLESEAQHAPIVLVVDDLHPADAETRRLRRHVLYPLEQSPLLVLGPSPEDAVGRTPPFAASLSDLRPADRCAAGGASQGP